MSGQEKPSKEPTAATVRKFQKEIYSHYREHGRILPWRRTYDPYCVLVSEIMLQQTQVKRVLEKYGNFITQFPDFASLAKAPLQIILSKWQGLGYNRRAIALKNIAQKVVNEFNGTLPTSVETLMTFPGIGKATAGAVAAFAYHQPTVFIETNIRRVYIHQFFQDKENITDSAILPLVEKTLDISNPREWYYALMDYGVMIKEKYENPNKRSAHYSKQSPFEGSNRQIRGMILRLLIHESGLSKSKIIQKTHKDEKKIETILVQLINEGFIKKRRGTFSLT
ncbi:MAG: A/G-specific adenine glycosylase [Candidatus Scalindua sp. AMX11]|nr:MAG: A/G-specific adenine glycosylase [Candidatus Scalindua sp.]NOG84749.1 A/G-specific adenine glycosylase [Planctomycetota bacterium]RZV98436.1 MAG: A/G-specific adenine glycosylase [Candidatus Scalindua sp. SCAELEC01]TDE66553.1 MAG: A/G-specific adenine glycosylase [Candidatus Scalindua sp. AMX11]